CAAETAPSTYEAASAAAEEPCGGPLRRATLGNGQIRQKVFWDVASASAQNQQGAGGRRGDLVRTADRLDLQSERAS
ncbi:MAG: hypothetical protein BJ554DRAFT_6755, partial [Olpidium bornovanus]